jgi:phage anti-repressor protein
MELIPIQQTDIQNEVVSTVNARDLHTELHISKHFTQWITYQINKAELDEGIDFILLNKKGKQKKGSGGHNAKDYLLTLDSAKHIAMMSRSKRAKEIRNYFISVEKKFKQIEKAYHTNNSTTDNRLFELLNQQVQTIAEQNKAVMEQLSELTKVLKDINTTKSEPYYIPTIPRWLDSSLTPNEKLICGTIATYKDSRGYCRLKNQDFAQMHGVTLRAIEKVISRMYRQGIIKNYGTRYKRALKITKILKEI